MRLCEFSHQRSPTLVIASLSVAVLAADVSLGLARQIGLAGLAPIGVASGAVSLGGHLVDALHRDPGADVAGTYALPILFFS